MGTHTIVDELEALFAGFQVIEGGCDVTFDWTEWEEQEEARGPHVTAETEPELEVSNIGGGAQMVTELVTLRFMWENQGRDAEWAKWKNAFIRDVLAKIRAQEKGFLGAYFTEVTDIRPERFLLDEATRSHGPAPYANAMEFILTARRHDVYGP